MQDVKPVAARGIGSIIAATVTIVLAGTADAQAPAGPGGAAGLRPPSSWAMTDGTLQMTPAAGWEANPRLAEDNGVIAFIHPSGMKLNQTIPAWILVDRRTRDPNVPFDRVVRACLAEGEVFSYIPADSAKLSTADGRALATYRFNLGADGSERGLAFLEAPSGTILFRYEAVSTEVWGKVLPALEAMLRTVRFLPDVKSPQ